VQPGPKRTIALVWRKSTALGGFLEELAEIFSSIDPELLKPWFKGSYEHPCAVATAPLRDDPLRLTGGDVSPASMGIGAGLSRPRSSWSSLDAEEGSSSGGWVDWVALSVSEALQPTAVSWL
jgi:hypothetical protein